MRTEQEMFDLILGFAREDERIRAVYMNGSRTNPNVPKDIFQDYDIVYVVNETRTFIEDKDWIHVFGELLIKQEPDKNDQSVGREVDFDRSYMYLMLFKDGNRIDLRLQSRECMLDEYKEDKLTVPLLDKDQILPSIPEPSDKDYHVERPTEELYHNYCNEFWWCLQNVAKGIWRDELPYANWMFENTSRNPLEKMISWWIGAQHDFSISPGKLGKYFKKHLPTNYWEMYEKTYYTSDYDSFWDSIFVACELFRKLGTEVADQLSFTYPMQDDQNMMKYLKRVREIPKDAEEIF
ncbi:aminoglycoside 6-adenylyltransferase [Bacillus carboniphilus]|uniref:Aminoglycoside 6-adenylyltransferase n=1 Tax=Bacillus carboniphilus TaxID=86663 RepID=A0ABN0WJX2_9BACI